MARMAHLSPVPIPPRHRPACRSISESYFALEPWDHRLPTRRFPRLLLQSLPARKWGLQSRASTGRGTCQARPRECLLNPWGTGLAHHRTCLRRSPLGYPSAGRIHRAPRYLWSSVPESRSVDASLQKATLPRALGCQLLSNDPTDVAIAPVVTPLYLDNPMFHQQARSNFQPQCHPWPFALVSFTMSVLLSIHS
jgi:hypothetical protein